MTHKTIINNERRVSSRRILFTITAICLILLIGTSPFLALGQSAYDVAFPGENLQRTYYSGGAAPNTANLLWKFNLNAAPGEFACAVVNGVVYQGCLATGDVYAINETNGFQIWHIALNNTANSISFYNGMIITQGGVLPYDPVYRSFGDEWVALDAQTGKIIWTYQVPKSEYIAPDAGTYGMPPVIANGRIYINQPNGIVILNAATGAVIDTWNIIALSFYDAYANGTLYGVEANQTDGKYYAFSGNPDTKTLYWISKDNPVTPLGYSNVGAGLLSAVAFSDDLFVGEYNFANSTATNRIFRIRASDGALAWAYPVEGYPGNNVAVAYNYVYVATSGGTVYAIDKTEGDALWTTNLGRVQVPIVVADQKLFVASEDASIYALDAFNGSVIWSYRTGGAVIGSPVVADGDLFVASRDQFLYAFGAPLPKPSSQITISAPKNVASGQAVKITGRLTDGTGTAVPGARLILQQRLVQEVEYSNVTTLTTDTTGAFEYSWTAPIDGYYDLNIVYNGDSLGPSSAAITVNVGNAASATNNLQTWALILLSIVLVLAVVSVVVSTAALREVRKKSNPK